LGSGVVTGPSRHQACDEGAEQGFAASARIMHELEEAEIKGQLVLRDAAMRTQPGRSSDQNPSMVLTWTSQNPSLSSSRAYLPRARRCCTDRLGGA